MKIKRPAMLRRRALRIDQDPAHPLYLFSLSGDEILQIADISRVSRDEKGKLIGYQRPEVKRHIQNIVDYLDSGTVIFPNSVILALSSDVVFRESRGPKVDKGGAVTGTLEIPLPQPGETKPAWIVDGQQRTLALTQSKEKRSGFPVPINAFVADNLDLQRDQFLRVNTTRPLPRGLIDELLPEVSTTLPANLAARKVPSALCELLNQDPESPFCGLIRRASSSEAKLETAVVTDTVIIKMLQESFSSPSGVLFPFRNVATGVTDFSSVRSLLTIYWSAVRDTFPEAWGLRPEKSRLMHGVGIRAMGRLMDRVMPMIELEAPRAQAMVKRELGRIQPFCRWTGGVWEGLGGLRWNEIQNLPTHHRMLSNFLIRAYLNKRKVS
ncbi:MAG: DGQHR domain-containing protein DpdB [Blastocatellales bacterium]